MKYTNESQVMDKLGIKSWRNLSKERFLEYIAVIPDVSEEVRLKIIEKLPECISFTKELVATMRVQHEKTLNENSKNTDGIINSLNAIQKSLDKISDRPELTFEDIKYICDKQMEIAKLYNELDKRNKDFLKYIWGGVVIFGIGVLAFIGSLLGNKYFGGSTSEDQNA